MVSRYQVTELMFKSGERFSLVRARKGGVPQFKPTAFVCSQLRTSGPGHPDADASVSWGHGGPAMLGISGNRPRKSAWQKVACLNLAISKSFPMRQADSYKPYSRRLQKETPLAGGNDAKSTEHET